MPLLGSVAFNSLTYISAADVATWRWRVGVEDELAEYRRRAMGSSRNGLAAGRVS